MFGAPALRNGEIMRPLRSEEEARRGRRELAIEREDREDVEAEEGYRRHAQAIWSER